jgi:hypothetical protein
LDLLIAFIKIWLILVFTMKIFVELEKNWKNTKKPISLAKSDPDHYKTALETKLEFLGVNLNQESLEDIAENVICRKWTGYKQYYGISYLVDQNYKLNSKQIDLIFKNSTGWYCSESSPIASLFASRGYSFSIDTLLKYNNPVCDHGWTVAHEMANQNHRFSVSDLILLGNPADIRGLKISDIMLLNGYQFTEVENSQLDLNYKDFNYVTYATYFVDQDQIDHLEEISSNCIKCGGKFSITNLTNNYPYQDQFYSLKLYSCSDCHWWILCEQSIEYMNVVREFNVLFIGVSKSCIPESVKYQKPWEKLLPNMLAYHHGLKKPENLLDLFAGGVRNLVQRMRS